MAKFDHFPSKVGGESLKLGDRVAKVSSALFA